MDSFSILNVLILQPDVFTLYHQRLKFCYHGNESKNNFLVFHHNDWQIFTSKGEKITLTLRIVKKAVSIKSNCFVNNYTYLALGSNLVVNLLVLCV